MYLNVIQLAESFGVAESVVEGWIRDEGLPCVRDSGRLMFDRAQVVAWAAERGLVAKAGFLADQPAAAGPASRLESWLRIGGIWRDVPAGSVREVLGRVVEKLPGATPTVRQFLAQRVQAPGGITWAAVGHGLALPHLRSHVALGREAGLLAMLFLRDPVSLDGEEAPDGVPVNRLLFFIAPTPRAHLELLAHLSAALSRGSLQQLVRDAAGDQEIFAAVAAAEAEAAHRSRKP